MSELKSALSALSKAIFPNRCELCGEVIELDETVCSDCKNPPIIKAPLCEFCGASKDECNCKKHKNEYKQIVAPYYYKDTLVPAIHRFKNGDMPFLANKLGDDIAKCISEHYSDLAFDMITFVPLRNFHERKRGFNQSELLANRVSKHINAPVISLLKKVRYTGVQHHKSAMERKADIFGAYDVADDYKNGLDGKTILLIDDVKTTGATLNECAKMLKIYGVKAVYCSAVAITNNEKN
ncbi:MAG: ComF family protein [Eubacterium sp.]|nr:ComF family protein [Eubacterium sp.]